MQLLQPCSDRSAALQDTRDEGPASVHSDRERGRLCSSTTHAQLTKTLSDNAYFFQEFHLSPLDLGTPYSRPRFVLP
jgi:hypothetical protein